MSNLKQPLAILEELPNGQWIITRPSGVEMRRRFTSLKSAIKECELQGFAISVRHPYRKEQPPRKL